MKSKKGNVLIVTSFIIFSSLIGAEKEDFLREGENVSSNAVCISEEEGKSENASDIYNTTSIRGSIPGFPEFLPGEQIALQKVIEDVRNSFESYGFVPIETPAVEKLLTLESKGIEGKEVYGLRRLNIADEADDGRKDLGLHFDLTVPLARYITEHQNKLCFPFKAYHIQKVWRGEKPSVGRYREFYQADIDVIGQDSLSLRYDAELPVIAYETLQKINVGDFIIRINNRKLLEGIFRSVGLENALKIRSAVKIVDNMEKAPEEETLASLRDLEMTIESAAGIFRLFSTVSALPPEGALEELRRYSENALFMEGFSELEAVVRDIMLQGVPPQYISVDPSIARGLDYYTGTIYETVLLEHKWLGSICSGGRYEDLAGRGTGSRLPGVGMSIGVSRIVPQLMRVGRLQVNINTKAPVLVTMQDQLLFAHYQHLASSLRQRGIATEIYLDNKKLRKQLDFANRKGFRFVIIANKDEIESGRIIIRDLFKKEQENISIEEIYPSVMRKLSEI